MWGIYQGLFLLFERLLGKKTLYQSLPFYLRVVFTFVIVLLGWVLFRAPSMGQAVHYWGSMLGFVEPTAATVLLHANIFSTHSIFSMIVCTIFTFQPFKAHQFTESLSPVKLAVIGAVLIVTVATMFTQAFSPFLYFQF
jgi:D-alanyl-lipoteichoic acid acyltransferase DltB (MBOAT superfamily)